MKLKFYKPRKKNERHKHKWGSDWYSLKEICKIEKCDYPTAKFYRQQGKGVRESIRLSKALLHRQRKYEYKGQTYNQSQLAKVLADEVGIKSGGMRNRLKRGFTIEQCLVGFRKLKIKDASESN